MSIVKLLDGTVQSRQKVITLGLIEYIIIVVLIFFISALLYYIYKSYAGPRKLEEIEKMLAASRTQAAINELNKFMEKDERNIKARYLLAAAHRKLGKPGTAVVELRQCIKLGRYSADISEIQIRSALASALLATRNYTDAKNEYLILTTLDQKDFEAYYQLGVLFDYKYILKVLRCNPTVFERDSC